MKLGLFGGSFDPIHVGHLAIAEGAKREAKLDRVVLMVARVSPHKTKTGAPPEERLAMARLAVTAPGLEVSDLEIRRAGPSYTIDTVRELKRLHQGAEVFLILGSDSLADFPKWREAAALLREATPLVAPREGATKEVLAPLRLALGDDAAAKLERGWLAIPLVGVSSSEIREKLARGEGVAGLVPDAVLAYARERGLYRAAP